MNRSHASQTETKSRSRMTHQDYVRRVNRLPESWPEPTVEQPDMAYLMEAKFDSECEATDGCTVATDGRCHHNHVSWLLYLRLI